MDAAEDQVMNQMLRVVNIRGGGRTERCHTVPHVGEYSNAKHQWGVAMLMWELWPADFQRLAIYCLSHDVAEKWVGDTPATAKKYISGLSRTMGSLEDLLCNRLDIPGEGFLSELDHKKLKDCDYLELYIWCIEQMQMGNNCVLEIIMSLDEFFEDSRLLPAANALLEQFRAHGIRTFPQRFRDILQTEKVAAE
jgi:5'-deoxynucleotidase YfbR-like HD superfamily hydrolase